MDLRDFIGMCEKVGQLKRVKAEVDWDLEISHICKIVEEKSGPALLFENVKGYESPVLTGAFGTTQRLAMILGKSPDLSMVQLTKEWVSLAVKEVIPAKVLKDGPIFENVLEGDKVDTFAFPSPRFYELDGGRYFGTAVFMVIEDPETGDINLGTYRMGILDEKTLGVQILKGKKGDRIMKKYGKQGKKMPACVIIGGDPLHIFASAATVAKAKSGYDVVGTLRGAPVEVVTSQVNGLPIPAAAEIVLEGEIDPAHLRNEGPFGEYTGYYTEELIKPIPKPALDVKRVYFRNKPILWETSVGQARGRPAHALCLYQERIPLDRSYQDADTGHQVRLYPAGGLRALHRGRLRAADVSGTRGPGGRGGHREQHGIVWDQDDHYRR